MMLLGTRSTQHLTLKKLYSPTEVLEEFHKSEHPSIKNQLNQLIADRINPKQIKVTPTILAGDIAS